jgi:predicted GNAT superfamily acetyltransferase
VKYEIIDAKKCDLSEILSLNQKAMPAVSFMDEKSLNYFYNVSEYFKLIKCGKKNKIYGFLIGLTDMLSYNSENYIWFSKRYSSFMYVDRIVIQDDSLGLGFGSMLYNDLINYSKGKFKNIICEYNIKPMNSISKKFHEKFGFKRVGSQKTEEGTKEVLMMEYSL